MTTDPAGKLLMLHQSAGNAAVSQALQPEEAITALQGGQPLDPATQAQMETLFDRDFSRVRIHTDEGAAIATESRLARAYTAGEHIVLGANRYAPHTRPGLQLLAHELTHVVQQQQKSAPSVSAHLAEREAQANGLAAVDGRPVTVKGSVAAGTVQCEPLTQIEIDLLSREQLKQRLVENAEEAQMLVISEEYRAELAAERANLQAALARLGGASPMADAENQPIEKSLALDKTVSIEGDPAANPTYIDNAFTGMEWALLSDSYTLYPHYDSGSREGGVSLPKSAAFLTDDPLAGFSGPINKVYRTQADAEAALSAIGHEDLHIYTYYLKDGYIYPTIISETTAPILVHNLLRAAEIDRKNAEATRDAFVDLAFWYAGARLGSRSSPKVSTPKGTGIKAPSAASKAPAAASAAKAFNAATVAEELLTATKSITNNGRRMLEATKQLSRMTDLTAQQKAEVILSFFRQIGFATSRAGVVDEGTYLIMHSEDGRYAFKIMKDSGEFMYGRFNMESMEFIWEALR